MAGAGNSTCDPEFVRRLLENQEQSGKMLIRRDLELSRANERLREIDKLKTDFISTATHQMRTPLAGIKWGLGMLLDGDFGPIAPEQELYLRKMYVSTDRMIELLRDMLFAEQVSSGTRQIAGAEADVIACIEAVRREMQPLAYSKNVRMDFVHNKDSYPKVKTSAENIIAIFQNLLENAVKYTHAGDIIKVELQSEQGKIRAIISDAGIGIPKEQQRHIFERFFRAENAKKEVTDGSGLGLYIVKQLVESMGGSIRFESEEGNGTTFLIELPVVQ